nr:MAG TPA: hypothetical protein [Caudoviricetes sp.]
MEKTLVYTSDPYEIHEQGDADGTFEFEEELMRQLFAETVERMTNEYGTLVMRGEIHAWDGVHRTAMVVRNFREVGQVIWERWVSDVSVYVDNDRDELVVEQFHHDGTNVWTFEAVSAKGRKWLANKSIGDHGANALGNHLAFTAGYTRHAGIKAIRKEMGW